MRGKRHSPGSSMASCAALAAPGKTLPVLNLYNKALGHLGIARKALRAEECGDLQRP